MNIQDIPEMNEEVIESVEYIKEQMKRIVLEEAKIKNGNIVILDSGCGGGNDLIDIKRRDRRIRAYGEDMHIKRNLKFKGVFFRKCNIEKSQRGKYDIIISSEVIHCLKGKNINKYLDNLNNMLKPDGLIVLTTFNRNYLWKAIYRFFRGGESWYHSTHIIFTPKELKKILEKRGFKVEKILGGRFVFGSSILNKIDFLPKSITSIRHNFLIAARKIRIN